MSLRLVSINFMSVFFRVSLWPLSFFFDQPDIVSAGHGILSIWLILSEKEKDV